MGFKELLVVREDKYSEGKCLKKKKKCNISTIRSNQLIGKFYKQEKQQNIDFYNYYLISSLFNFLAFNFLANYISLFGTEEITA